MRANYLIIIFLLIIISCNFQTQPPPTQLENLSLFNGKDFTGWIVTKPNLWRVENKEIIGSFQGTLKRNNFLISKHTIKNFHLTFEVKLVNNKGNSGVQFWSIPHGKDSVEGYQADIGPKWWGKLYHEHGKRKGGHEGRILSKKNGEKYVKKNGWNKYEIIAVGNKIQTKINGKLCANYIEKNKKIGRSHGQIALQLHSGKSGMQIHFRNFKLNQTNPEKQFVKEYKKLSKGQAWRGNSDTKLLSPKEEQKKLIVPEGFVIELVASETMKIPKIVDIAFDTKGRMWASTASEYPADEFNHATFDDIINNRNLTYNKHAQKLWKDGGIDQILIFPNPTAKNPSKPLIFSSNRALPMGVLPYKTGAIIIEGRNLLLLQDTDGDNKADSTKVLASGFGVQDTHTGAHGLKYMPGNWVTVINGILNWGDVKDADGKITNFARTGIALIKPDGTQFHITTKGFQNIWGFYQNKVGKTWMHEANNLGFPLVPYYEQMSYWMSAPGNNRLKKYMTYFPKVSPIFRS